MKAKTRKELFDLIRKEHGISLFKTDYQQIENIILKDYKEKLPKEVLKVLWQYEKYKINK